MSLGRLAGQIKVGRSFLVPIYDDRRPFALLRATRQELVGYHGLPSVGFDSEEADDDDGFWLAARVHVRCPVCRIGVRPLTAYTTTRWVDSGTGWSGIDYRVWWSDYICRCHSGHRFRLHTHTSE